MHAGWNDTMKVMHKVVPCEDRDVAGLWRAMQGLTVAYVSDHE